MPLTDSLQEFKTQFNPHLNKVLRVERGQFGSDWNAVEEYILNGGKRLRPFILWMMAKQHRDDIRHVFDEGFFDALSAFEILHNSTLIHDDIIDHHQERRNAPTLTSVLSPDRALILGNILHGKGYELLCSADLPEKFKQECLATYPRISSVINKGQLTDLNFRGRLDIDEVDLIKQIESVAAKFVSTMFELGVEDGDNKQSWEKVGLYFGIILQLVDDLLDIDKQKNKGRGIGADIKEGKSTPLYTFAFCQLSETDRIQFKEIFGKDNVNDDKLEWVIEKCREVGAIRHVGNLIQKYNSKIRDTLKNVGGVSPEHWVYEFADYSVSRTS